MELYIPKHLKNIAIFRQLCNMIEEYGKEENGYYIDPTDSFDKYRIYRRIDPVKNFIELCIKQQEDQTDEEYNAIITYLSAMFYSVKGTCKVFEYMKNYLDIKFEETHKIPYIYTVRRLEINIEKASIDDETLYYDAIKGFLDTLLYFEELDLNINKFELKLDERLENYLQLGNVCYKKINIQGLELAWRDTETNEIVNTLNLTLPESKLVEEINWVDIDSRDEISKLSLMNPVGDKLVRSIDWKENEQSIGDNLNFELEPADTKVRGIVWTDMDGETYDSLILNNTGEQKDLIANCYPLSATMRLVDFYGINDEIINANRQSATSSLIYVSGKKLGETSIKVRAKDDSLVTAELPIYVTSSEAIRAKKEGTSDPDLIYYLDEELSSKLDFLTDWKAYSYYGDNRERKTVYYCSKPLEDQKDLGPVYTDRSFVLAWDIPWLDPLYHEGIGSFIIQELVKEEGRYRMTGDTDELTFTFIKYADDQKNKWICEERGNVEVTENILLTYLLGSHEFIGSKLKVVKDQNEFTAFYLYIYETTDMKSNGILLN